MKQNIITLLILVLTFSTFSLWSQQLNHVQGEVLVMLDDKTNVREWALKYESFNGKTSEFTIHKRLSVPMNIWSFKFDFAHIDEQKLLNAIWEDPAVKITQFNHFITMRSTIPNDPQFDQQWQYINTGQDGGTVGADIDMDLAWDITTGGVTALGDTIVVCVIDSGIDLNHEDFGSNLWQNHSEIPGNGIDDDNNGYVDDYNGWHPNSNSDNVNPSGGHGTSVAGIVGAKGNNEIGVSGVSWDVKLMIVKNGSLNEASVIETYSYPLTQRKIYNETNGAEGAFVVATNASWGINNGQPSESPLWCAFYDTLGYYGILSCGATANANFDIDAVGDLPTACPSDYLIAVTNMNRDDEKVTGAGYGLTTIDLGAFGAETWTTGGGGGYTSFGGTSGATPHVTGAIGLLYSVPCPAFASLAKSAPSAAAELIKQVILDGTDHNVSLVNITTTEGRLNVYNSILLLLDNCDGCFSPTSISANAITVSSANINWVQSDSITQINIKWRVEGTTDWTEVEEVSFPFNISDLLLCGTYEVQVQGYCGNEILNYSDSYIFTTEGCCEAPSSIEITDITANSATFSWNSIVTATGYIFEYRETGTALWTMVQSGTTDLILSDLGACVEYEYRLTTHCSINGEIGEIATFRTMDCGDCADAEYCIPQNLEGGEEWIDLFVLGSFSNTSGIDDSYGDYTLLGTIELEQGAKYPIQITPDYLGNAYTEDLHIYIDYNHNNIFEENETAFQMSNFNTTFEDTLHIPANAPLGLTRMRLVMQASSVDNSCPSGSSIYGEVEDYCVEIGLIDATRNIDALANWVVNPNPFSDKIQLTLNFDTAVDVLQIEILDQFGRTVLVQNKQNLSTGRQMISLDTNDLPSGVYFISLRTNESGIAAKKIVKIE